MSPFTKSYPVPPSERSGPSRPRPAGMGGGGPSMAPRSWQGAGKDSWATAPMALVQSPRKEEKEVGEGRGRGGQGRQGGSAAQFVAKFFFSPFFPFFLCKKCTKARQPRCSGQQCFLGMGRAGRGPQAWHPSLHLKVASYCLETSLSLNTRLKIELGGPPSLLPDHSQSEQLQ